MKKRGQSVTLIIIIALGFLAVVLFSLHFNSENNQITISPEFKSQTDTLKNYVTTCLQQKTLESIELYGISPSTNPLDRGAYSSGMEPLLEEYVEQEILGCIDKSQFPEVQIEFESPKSNITIEDKIIISKLTLPTEIVQEQKKAKFSEYIYSISTKKALSISQPGGKTQKEYVLITEDKKATLIIPKQTVAKDSKGKLLDAVSLKITEKNFEDLYNTIVIGSTVFQAQPDGATFDPPINLKIIVNYNDVPYGFDPKEMMCAYYDQPTGIWRAYPTNVVDNPAENSYTLNCEVSHFSVIAAVQCGQEVQTKNITLDPFYQAPITPVDPEYWMYNENQDGLHLIPETVGECEFSRGMGLNIEHYTKDRKDCEDLVDDWDQDDQEKVDFDFGHVIEIDGNYGTFDTIHDAQDEIDTSEIYYQGNIIDLGNFEEFNNKCKQFCIQKAKDKISQEFGEPTITSDAINDDITKLYCLIELEKQGGTFEVKSLPSSKKDCMVYDSVSDQYPFDNIEDPFVRINSESKEIKTMEYPEREFAFYATPETLGYPETRSIELIAEDEVDPKFGGKAEYFFNISTNGEGCQDSTGGFELKLIVQEDEEKEYNLDKKIVVPEKIKTMDLFDGSTDNLYKSCSDQCIWSFNNGEPAHKGENIVQVTVNNILDPALYASGTLEFKGEGLSISNKCDPKKVPTLQSKINKLHSVSGSNIWDPSTPQGRELNCIALYRDFVGGIAGQSTSLCDVDFANQDFQQWLSSTYGSVGYCKCITYDPSKSDQIPAGCSDMFYVPRGHGSSAGGTTSAVVGGGAGGAPTSFGSLGFQLTGKCGKAAEKAAEAVMRGCGYADIGNPADANCAAGLSCAQLNNYAFMQGMGHPRLYGHGKDWCNGKISISGSQLQPGDIFSQDFGSYGHTGMIIGKGKVSNIQGSRFTTRNGVQMCYTEFQPDPNGEIVFAHSYGWISGGRAQGRACFTPASVLQRAFSGVKTVFCRKSACQ